MRLFEAIIDANHRAVAGDKEAGLHPADFENELPVIALTCIDPRLNAFFPNALALPADQFIWLRNAGNIIFDPMSSMMRTLALACAVKGGKEIAIIGHTNCLVGKTTTLQLLERFKELGIERHLLPENLNEFFGLFSSERQNVIKSCDIVRHSPLIGPKIPVHGLVLNIETGELDWIVNGYQTLDTMASRLNEPISPAGATPDLMKSLPSFHFGEMKFPEGKIGELATKAEDWLSKQTGKIGTPAQEAVRDIAPVAESVERVAQQAAQYAEKHWPKPPTRPPKIPIPPPIRPVKRR
ncbi:MAG: carbonic anhydrase [Verrucomicrobiia bacterium]